MGPWRSSLVLVAGVVACAGAEGGRDSANSTGGPPPEGSTSDTEATSAAVSTGSTDPTATTQAPTTASDDTNGTSGGPSSCGNGIVEAGEQCDLGPNNGESAACTPMCEDARCGDGFVFPRDEYCDDGNADETDACTSLCAAPACDDGITSGDETDVDCGGSCSACVAGSACLDDDDCLNQACTEGLCSPAESCAALLALHSGLDDGVYTIDPSGGGIEDAVVVFCDMTTDGGGWTALAANGDISVPETSDPLDCYPLVSDQRDAGCGTTADVMDDFALPGPIQGGISWRYMLAIVYGDGGYDDKLAFFAIDFGAAQPTAEERFNGNAYLPTGITTTFGELACDGFNIVHYTRSGTYIDSGVASGKGTVFGHDSVITMNDSTRRTFGFTDTAEASATQQAFGVDDYQDGWSCSDLWAPQEVRGQRMIVLVR